MKRVWVAAAMSMVAVCAAPAIAGAEDNQPSQGENSTGRNEQGFGGGPHCHLLAVEQANGHFGSVRVFPSHTAHVRSGLGEGPFVADSDCDGM